MAAPGVELILGLRRDPQFGPAVLVGLGGVLTEVLDDVAIRLAPLDAAAAGAMLDDLRGARLLGGVRGRPAVDRAAVVAMLVALGRLGMERPDILEVDLNPVIAIGRGRDRGRRAGRAGGTRRCPSLTRRSCSRRETAWGVRLTLNRPAKLNALSGELVAALVGAIDRATRRSARAGRSSSRAPAARSPPATT